MECPVSSKNLTGRANDRKSPTLTSVGVAPQSVSRTKADSLVAGRAASVSAASYVRNRTGTPKSPFTTRQGGWKAYSFEKNAWIAAHPNATATEIDAAAKRIARELGL